jgi:hypothetical protein
MLCSCSNNHSYVFEYVGIIQNVEFDKYTQRAGYEGVTVGDTLLYNKETFINRAYFTYKKKD